MFSKKKKLKENQDAIRKNIQSAEELNQKTANMAESSKTLYENAKAFADAYEDKLTRRAAEKQRKQFEKEQAARYKKDPNFYPQASPASKEPHPKIMRKKREIQAHNQQLEEDSNCCFCFWKKKPPAESKPLLNEKAKRKTFRLNIEI